MTLPSRPTVTREVASVTVAETGRASVSKWRKALTQRWINGEVSNFHYLMYLNTIAGRSFNDLTQVLLMQLKIYKAKKNRLSI